MCRHIPGTRSGALEEYACISSMRAAVQVESQSRSGLNSTSSQQSAVVIRTHEPYSDHSQTDSQGTVGAPTTQHARNEPDTSSPAAPLDAPVSVANTSAAGGSTSEVSGPQSVTQGSISLLDALLPEGTPESLPSAAIPSAEAAAATGKQGSADSNDESAVQVVPMRDVSSSSIALSVLFSFTLSLGMVTWAGVVARIAEKGL